MHQSICSLYHKGARVIRLDAFGYFTKKLGTRCFFEVKVLSHYKTLKKDRVLKS